MGDPVGMVEAFRKAGLKVNEYPGWRGRGHGDFGKVWGPFMHHTGSFGETPRGIAEHPSLGLASQWHLAPNGVYTICGIGIAWHAGTGSWPTIPTNNGNAVCVGFEAAHNGTAAWSKPQLDAYLKGVQTLNIFLDNPWDKVVAHKEYGKIQGKWDPGNLDMKWVRQQLKVRDIEKPVVINMIELEAKENPWVGVRHAKPGAEGEMKIGRDFRGRQVEYDHANIYFYPGIGAFAIPHADPKIPGSGIFEAYGRRGFERGPLGYPVRDFSLIEGHGVSGAVMAFQGGLLYVANDPSIGDHMLGGVIGQRWALEGWEDGPLGWPITDEYDNGTGGKRQEFQFGTLEWDPSGAIKKLGTEPVRNLSLVDDKGYPLAVTEGVELIAA
ncbi:endolysin [Gordonia phage Terapin]|uniref:Lysin A n=4 Tax=Terapinvirus terapin TaxID=2734283 RepID=A0A345MB69_9CAUD|nr:endolysin [Gordonia phage Terapin]AOE44842.1 lysin A [Gordonia phage Terapin]AVP43306.1 lysin A [Gordonia phage Djokovic]AXH67740.1 lysin A [Gordonia phage Beyoncage]QOC56599.1 lysin A [Gordonia phage BiteSize]